MSNISVETRLKKFLKDKELLNKQLEAGVITPETYHRRHEEMRRRVDGPLPLTTVVKSVEYAANNLKTGLFYIGRTQEEGRLDALAEMIRSTMENLARLLEDVETLKGYKAPHALLEIDLDQIHPCLKCICFNQLEPEKRHEACEDCADIDAREAYEADRIPYYDGVEAGQ